MAKQKYKVKSTIKIENARIAFRNFSGKAGKYNPEGSRQFVVFLEDEDAEMFAADGWNIKYLEPRDEHERPQAYLPVAVTYNYYPPRIWLVTDAGKTIVEEDTVHLLDWADIIKVDLIVRPYNWEIGEKTGVKAMLKTMAVTIAEDDIEKKYRDVPDSAANSPDVFQKPPWED